MSKNVKVVSHPLVEHHLSFLRERGTPPVAFRHHLRQLSVLLASVATADLPTSEQSIETPMTAMTARRLRSRIGIIPILRAGLGMVDPILELIPESEVWHLGLYRDEETSHPVKYYSRLDDGGPVDVAIIVDPMLATGGSAMAAIEMLEDWGVARIKLLSVIAAPEGIQRVSTEFPDVQINVCAVDERLNDINFIVPGLGDAGDRCFNTPT